MPRLSRGLVTERDRAAVDYVAAHPWVVSEQVRRFLSLASQQESRHVAAQVARRRLLVLVSHGLLAHGLLRLFGMPLSAYWLTRRGAVFLGQDIAPGGVDIRQLAHDAAVADLHLALLSRAAQDVWTARTLASARARGALPEGLLAPLGGRHVHVPDLVARLADGRRVAFEVEMSRKAPRRLVEIMRAYRLARGLDAVAYLTPGEARARALADAARGVSKVSVSRLETLVPVPSWPRR
jgi:hypothetical protein